MKAIMLMFDSLNRHMLPAYGCDWTKLPNFERLAKRTVTFDNCYIGSMPCMPARRELHTGRYNFLHRSWGPLEPFDDSMPQILSEHGIYTHLSTDHQHYWEDGGATYHQRYDSFDFSRGQEGDKWIGMVGDVMIPPHHGQFWRQDVINRMYMDTEEKMPQTKTFANAFEFIERNHDEDSWFLQLETFDPHEPFYTMPEYKALYPHTSDGVHFDWPEYRPLEEGEEKLIEHIRCENAALLSQCDKNLGKLLDLMDEYEMWDDTLLIVNTDHGFLLGEHNWWAKAGMPYYQEIAHIPLFIHDPRYTSKDGERRQALLQNRDLPVYIMKFFGLEPTPDMEGEDIAKVLSDDSPIHDYVLFGVFGGHVCITDGHYVYMRSSNASNCPLNEYTLMPTHMRQRFAPSELSSWSMSEGFSFTKGCRLMKISASKSSNAGTGKTFNNTAKYGNLLFDVEKDPCQKTPMADEEIEKRMIMKMVELMKCNDAPYEQYQRLNLEEYVK